MKFERGTICGFDINDVPELTFVKDENGKVELIQAYKTWTGMIDRCYRPVMKRNLRLMLIALYVKNGSTFLISKSGLMKTILKALI